MSRRTRTKRVQPEPQVERPPPTHSLVATMSGSLDPQSSSPLFAIIPPEIRNRIFSFSLYSYDNTPRPYPDASYYSRPGYRYHQSINTALLETCKRIYTETHDLPVSQNEHVFWCSSSRGPQRAFCDNPSQYFQHFTEEQKAAVNQVHLFTQLFWLEGSPFRNFCNIQDIRPQYLKITIRHTDWWFWESNTPLRMASQWMDNLKNLDKLHIFDLELETMERDKDQLETIVKDLVQRRIPLARSHRLTTHGNPVTKDRYIGTAAFGSSIYYSSEHNRWIGSRPPSTLELLPYVVSTIRWISDASK